MPYIPTASIKFPRIPPIQLLKMSPSATKQHEETSPLISSKATPTKSASHADYCSIERSDSGQFENRKFERFSSKEKKGLVALVSWCGLMPRTSFRQEK